MNHTRRILSFLMIAGGVVLLFLGAREVWESHFGQTDAAREFQSEPAAPPLSTPSPRAEHPPEPGEAMAKLIFPRLDAQLYVVEGDSARDLRRGPGHLRGTAMPGGNGNCVIAGHRDTHFRLLKDVQPGDDIVLQTRNGKFLYRVKKLEVVSSSDTAPLQPTSEAELNLITCYPFYYVGSAPKRFVVEARLAGSVESAQPSL